MAHRRTDDATECGLPIADGIIGAGGEITWPTPLRAGDTIHVENEIVAVTPSRSRPDRGIVTVVGRTLNQHGVAVQVTTMKLLVFRKDAVARGENPTIRKTA